MLRCGGADGKVDGMTSLQSEPRRQPFLNAPAVVLWLIGALFLVHVAMTLAPAKMADELLTRFAFTPASYARGGDLFWLAVPWVSHMALHGSFLHVGMNCLWLLACGPIVARRYGGGLFLLFFLLCGIAGAATYLALNWASPDPVIGASGAISGLMAAAVRMLRWPNADPLRPLAPILSRPILFFSAVWLATNYFFGMTGLGTGGDIRIAWQAHLGGYLFGLFAIAVLEWLRHGKTARSLEAR